MAARRVRFPVQPVLCRLGYFANIFRYDFATGDTTQLTDFPLDVDLVHDLSISPDGQQVVFERMSDEFVVDPDSSVWIMNIDGSGVRKLVDNAGRPAWGRTAGSAGQIDVSCL